MALETLGLIIGMFVSFWVILEIVNFFFISIPNRLEYGYWLKE